METARKIINQALSANIRIADDYTRKAQYELYLGNIEEAKKQERYAQNFLDSAEECKKALLEIEGINETELSKTA